MIKYIILLFTLSKTLCFFSQPLGYNYGKHIQVPSSSVSGSSDLIDFPLLISVVDPDLRTVSNSGHLEQANGFDIVFTSSDCNTLLSHQIEKYDPTTGELVIWVKIPRLLASKTTDIHMYYGNSSVTTDPSSNSTFNSNYEGCWHMSNDPSSSFLIDYSGNNINGTSFGAMTSTDLVSGKIGDAIDFDGTNDYFALANKSYVGTESVANLTISAWVKTSFNNSTWSSNWSILDFDRSEYFNVFVHGDGRLGFSTTGTNLSDSYAGTAGDLNDGSWHYITAVYDGVNKLLYIDGALSLTESNPHSGNPLGDNITRFGFIGEGSEATTFNGSRNNIYYQGQYDEIHFLEHALSSDWIKTEFDNQNNPSSFYTIGSEESASDLCAIALDVSLNYFDAIYSDDLVNLEWGTYSEINNSHFTIDKSINGIDWEEIFNIEGAVNSVYELNYNVKDYNLIKGLNYYKLKQYDIDGTETELGIKTVFVDNLSDYKIKVYPNPAKNILTIELKEYDKDVKIYDLQGRNLTSLTGFLERAESKYVLDISRLPKGVYFIKSLTTQIKFLKE